MDGADGAVDGAAALPRPRLCLRRLRYVTGVVAVTGVAAVVLFLTYVQVSSTQPVNTDDANTMMMAWAMLHDNVLLHGWWMSDVSFYTTELPQYAPAGGDARAASANRSRRRGHDLHPGCGARGAAGHGAVAAGSQAAGRGLRGDHGGDPDRTAVRRGRRRAAPFIGHIGTSVPLMAILLLLDRARPRWQVPVLAGLGLSWVMVADKAVLLTAVGPLILVCGSRSHWPYGPPGHRPRPRCATACEPAGIPPRWLSRRSSPPA
jgi:hypothetical protein